MPTPTDRVCLRPEACVPSAQTGVPPGSASTGQNRHGPALAELTDREHSEPAGIYGPGSLPGPFH